MNNNKNYKKEYLDLKHSGGMFPVPLNLYKSYKIEINDTSNTLTITPIHTNIIIIKKEKDKNKTTIVINNINEVYTYGNITKTSKNIPNRQGSTKTYGDTIETNNSIITYKSNFKWNKIQPIPISKPPTPPKLPISPELPTLPLTDKQQGLNKLLMELGLIPNNISYNFEKVTTFTKQINDYHFFIVILPDYPNIYYLIGTKSKKYLNKLKNMLSSESINLLTNIDSELKSLHNTQHLVNNIDDKLSIYYIKTRGIPLAFKKADRITLS